MKKPVLTLAFAVLCLAASAHSRTDEPQHLGRHGSDSLVVTESVPEVAPTLALVLMSVASLTVFAAYLRGKRSRAQR